MNIFASKLLRPFFIVPILIMSTIFSRGVSAQEVPKAIIDVYGTSQFTASDIQNKYGKDFETIAKYLATPNGPVIYEKELSKLWIKVRTEINSIGDFAFLDVSPLYYRNLDDVYFTIDIVDKKDSSRLTGFTPNPKKTIKDPEDLIASWQEYEKIASQHVMSNKNYAAKVTCPVSHCIFGFEEPELKKYKDIFVIGVLKHKNQLIKVLYEDQDENKRAAAAFLLGNLKNSDDVINIMIPAMHDSSERVRNNAMRVLGAALEAGKTANFPIKDAVAALDYPTEVNRNKALYILLSLSAQPRYAKYIKDHAGEQLMTELRMSQPNLHISAYYILKKISGLQFTDHDYNAWQNWLNSQKPS
jgi:hypothetical protein